MHAGIGNFITPAARAVEYMTAPIGRAATRAGEFIGEKFNQVVPALDEYLGSKFMSPQATLERVTGGTPPMNLTRQAQESLVRSPTGEIVQGTGTKLAPYRTLGEYETPTLSAGMRQGVNEITQAYPRASKAAALGAAASVPFLAAQNASDGSTPLSPEAQANWERDFNRMRDVNQPSMPKPSAPTAKEAFTEFESDKQDNNSVARAYTDTDVPEATVSDFIQQQLGRQNGTGTSESAAAKKDIKSAARSRMDRIKDYQKDYQGLYRELLGGDSEDAKMNALLLLSEAGFKLAGTAAPTMAMAISSAASGVPRGLAAIAAGQRERQMKVDSAALSQAITDVGTEDKYTQQQALDNAKAYAQFVREGMKEESAVKKSVLEHDLRMIEKRYENEGGGGTTYEDLGLGIQAVKTKKGQYIGTGVLTSHPTAQSILRSDYNLNPEVNPYVRDRGAAPSMVVDSKEAVTSLRKELEDNEKTLNLIQGLKGDVASLYGPSTFINNAVNGTLVPITPTVLLKPDVEQEAKIVKMTAGLNSYIKSVAAAQSEGRASNYQIKIAEAATDAIKNPTAFWSNPQLAAGVLNQLDADARTGRHTLITRGGYSNRDLVMDRPATGTESDPFIMSSDPLEYKKMKMYLQGGVAPFYPKNAYLYVRMPGTKEAIRYTPDQLMMFGQ
jgi:hypothetical protein